MLILRPNFDIIKYEDGYNYVLGECTVSDVSELNTEIISDGKNFKLTEGCVCWDISTGDFYGLNSSDEWIKQGGEE